MRRRFRRKPAPAFCHFCKAGKEPEYKDVETLKKFTSERGKILGHNRNGLCSKHQRKLTKHIKYARLLALTPFVQKVK